MEVNLTFLLILSLKMMFCQFLLMFLIPGYAPHFIPKNLNGTYCLFKMFSDICLLHRHFSISYCLEFSARFLFYQCDHKFEDSIG